MLVGREREPQQRMDTHEELLAGAAGEVGLARAVVVVLRVVHFWRSIKNTGKMAMPIFLSLLACLWHILRL
eukprot:3582836-Prymnesium_polylepis.1